MADRNKPGGGLVNALIATAAIGITLGGYYILKKPSLNTPDYSTSSQSVQPTQSTNTARDLDNIPGVITNKDELAKRKETPYSLGNGITYGYTNKIIDGRAVRVWCEIGRDKDQYQAYLQKEKETAEAKKEEQAAKKKK